MKINYHRVAGQIGLTHHEAGTRGTWVEKRRNVLRDLATRHDVQVLSVLTKATREAADLRSPRLHFERAVDAPCDLLVLEFGPSNGAWFADDFEWSRELVKAHKGPIAYLCDDPDLIDKTIGRYVPQLDWSRWTVVCNCLTPTWETLGLLACRGVECATFNPGVGLPFQEPVTPANPALLYAGRPNNRRGQVAEMVASMVVQFCGKPKEWESLRVGPIPSPEQSQRQEFYRQFAGTVASFDAIHARAGWRTGRAYHAAHAGVPVAAFEGNPALAWASPVASAADLQRLCFEWEVPSIREHLVQIQQATIYSNDPSIFDRNCTHRLGL